MRTLAEGTLVRVRPEETQMERNIVQDHGVLWIRKEAQDSDIGLYWYRSLATGFDHLWCDREIETAEQAGD